MAARLRVVLLEYPPAPALVHAMIEERIDIPFFVQCDTQVALQEDPLALLHDAGRRQNLPRHRVVRPGRSARREEAPEPPRALADLVRPCHRHGIAAHFSRHRLGGSLRCHPMSGGVGRLERLHGPRAATRATSRQPDRVP